MRNSIAVALLLAGLATPAMAQDRMAWFRHDKFGMFIHWGPYSLLAGEWKDHPLPVGTEAEWIMQRFNIPVKEYREVARRMNPVKFNAGEWVNLAKSAGMKYLVITAKHHDGFAMYHSRVSPYNIVDWTPFKRDPLEELAAACRKAGIRFCVYYSHREDWDDPDAFGNTWDYDPARKNFQRYLERKSLPQVRELLTNYGPLGLIWFDRGLYTAAQTDEFVNLVHSLQPLCLINGRVGPYGEELMGDYQDTGDNGMPPGGLQEDWETPQTLNGTWGYSKFDQDWKTPATVVQRLAEVASKGGNYLLNIGPLGDGSMPAPGVAALEKVGAWLRRNGESIYGTSACPLGGFPWGRCTVRGEKIYLHVFSWPGDAVLRLSGLTNQVKAAYLLGEPGRKLPVARRDGAIAVSLPARGTDDYDTVVVLEVAGPPQATPPIVTQDSDSNFQLDYLTAVTAGKAHKRFLREGIHIADWTAPGDSATWRLMVSRPGVYQVSIRYAARAEAAPGKYVVEIGPRALTGAVEATPGRTAVLGTVKLAKAGDYTVSIHPAAASGHNLMYFQSLALRLQP